MSASANDLVRRALPGLARRLRQLERRGAPWLRELAKRRLKEIAAYGERLGASRD